MTSPYMRIIVDINHPAHVHFFKYPIQILRERGHDVLVASRVKDVTIQLLDELQIEHVILSSQTTKGVVSLAKELVQRDWRLYQLAKKWKANCLTAIGGTFSAHAGFVARIPSIVFYDTENARFQNFVTYPFVTRLYVPQCYTASLPSNAIRYPGYHELTYLHPNRFAPNRSTAIRNGLAPSGPTFLVRTLAWMANHDIGSTGWSTNLLSRVIDLLSRYGHVLLSAEGNIDHCLLPYAYTGQKDAIHHVMAYSSLYIGESATMASECAVLGTPSIYAARSERGYTTEQEHKYGLVRNIYDLTWATIHPVILDILSKPSTHWISARDRLLADNVDVTQVVVTAIEDSGLDRLAV